MKSFLQARLRDANNKSIKTALLAISITDYALLRGSDDADKIGTNNRVPGHCYFCNFKDAADWSFGRRTGAKFGIHGGNVRPACIVVFYEAYNIPQLNLPYTKLL